jgi:hypothetical protein
MATIDVPKELESLRDAAVAFAHGKLKKCPDLEPLQEWFENGDGWDDVVMSIQGGVVHLGSVADKYFSNSMLRDYVDVPAKARISKAQKLTYARERLDHEFSQADDSLHAVQISNDPDTYLACFIFGQGQGGWEVDWIGLVNSTEELTSLDEGCWDYFVSSDRISDEKILSLWGK